MKLRRRDYIRTVWDIVLGRSLKRAFVQARYLLELRGRGGYLIHGGSGYSGRYGTLEKIVELVSEKNSSKGCISFELPAIQYDLKYSHMVNIWIKQDAESIRMEFIYASDQCGSYEKNIPLSNLLDELKILPEAQRDVLEQGYRYVQY